MSSAHQQSILVIGAEGRTGLQCVRHFAKHQTKPAVHAFCRDARKLDDKDMALCKMIVQGDARRPIDLERALAETHADVVVLSIGYGDSAKKSYIRTASANAMVQVLKMPQFERIHTVVVSSVGAGNSRISPSIGVSLGKLISFHLRHVLADHTGQENAFYNLRNRTTIVRATDLTENEATGKLASFQDREKPPSSKTDRADLAAWIVDEVCGGTKPVGGRVVNITGVKEEE
jgi:NAD(P)-dependent dehydrogenase (short-subunit alcohol dehydrogenase family)